jgi:hypothetical protein
MKEHPPMGGTRCDNDAATEFVPQSAPIMSDLAGRYPDGIKGERSLCVASNYGCRHYRRDDDGSTISRRAIRG